VPGSGAIDQALASVESEAEKFSVLTAMAVFITTLPGQVEKVRSELKLMNRHALYLFIKSTAFHNFSHFSSL